MDHPDAKVIEALQRETLGFRDTSAQAIDVRAKAIVDNAISCDLDRGFSVKTIGSVADKGGFSRQMLRQWIGYSAFGILAILAVVQVVPLLPSLQQPTASVSQFKEYSTTPGQRAAITLKDGTQVMLNVASRIRIANDYNKDASTPRVIDLTGEAQFIVTHNSKRPFTVRANGTLVRDLATTFVVRAYPGAPTTRVAVRDGRVSVQPPVVSSASAVTINAGKAAIVNPDSKIFVRSIANNDLYFGWTKGHLVLSKVPLPEALSELGRWYGMDFRVADRRMLSINDISGAFPQSLTDERLRAIADIIGARVQRSGTTVIFHPMNPDTNNPRLE